MVTPMAVDRLWLILDLSEYKWTSSIDHDTHISNQSIANNSSSSSDLKFSNNEDPFISLNFRNRMHQWCKIGIQREYARNNCRRFINVTS